MCLSLLADSNDVVLNESHEEEVLACRENAHHPHHRLRGFRLFIGVGGGESDVYVCVQNMCIMLQW